MRRREFVKIGAAIAASAALAPYITKTRVRVSPDPEITIPYISDPPYIEGVITSIRGPGPTIGWMSDVQPSGMVFGGQLEGPGFFDLKLGDRIRVTGIMS